MVAVERHQPRPRGHRRPHAARPHRRRASRRDRDPVAAIPRWASSCCRSTWRRRYASELLAGDGGGDRRGVGYLLKDRIADVGEFLGAVRRVGEGGTALDPEVVAQLLARSRRRDPLARLTATRTRSARR
jgi:hypothetical protein